VVALTVAVVAAVVAVVRMVLLPPRSPTLIHLVVEVEAVAEVVVVAFSVAMTLGKNNHILTVLLLSAWYCSQLMVGVMGCAG